MKKENGGPRLPIGIGLLVMSLGSGCLDVLSYHDFGEVFTSAMTGNLALLGLRLGRGDAVNAASNGAAFAGFIGGLFLGMAWLRGSASRGRLLQALVVQLGLLTALAALWPPPGDDEQHLSLIALSALAMGMQSAVAHRIGVHAVSTTYFTGTLANIVYGLVEPKSTPTPTMAPVRRVAWPIMAFLTYLGGAAIAGHHLDRTDELVMIPALTTLVLIIIIAIAGPKVRAGA